MLMDGWVDYLHLQFRGEHVLFHFIRLHSFSSFFFCSIVVIIICLLEKLLTVILNKNIHPVAVRRSRLATAAWKSSLYAVVTFLRLLYMLVAMSNQLGTIAVVVITLSMGQFVIEYAEYREPRSGEQFVHDSSVDKAAADRQVTFDRAEEPLLRISPGARRRPIGRRSHGRSKPDAIFIHPNESNRARADAFALELGIGDETELVKGNRADGQAWELGRGRDVARKTFGDPHRRLDSEADGFDDDDDDDGAGMR